MTITYLKRGKPDAEREADDAGVRATVQTTLADISVRGDAAVRDLSQKFDGYAPAAFRLTASEIEAAMSRVSERYERYQLCPNPDPPLCPSAARLYYGYRS
jgi:sulfopropanediol 3-dehydrogenase